MRMSTGYPPPIGERFLSLRDSTIVARHEVPGIMRKIARPSGTIESISLHCIFSTKERAPMLNPELRERLWPFLGGIAKQNGITPRCIGGGGEHVPLLLSFPTTAPNPQNHS